MSVIKYFKRGEWFLHLFVLTRWETVRPVPTKAVLQPAKAATMCMAWMLCTARQLLHKQKGWDRGSGWCHPLSADTAPAMCSSLHAPCGWPHPPPLSHWQLQQLHTTLWCYLSLVPRPPPFSITALPLMCKSKNKNREKLWNQAKIAPQ